MDGDSYLLACHRYIELNPVRAGMVNTPEECRWSSFRHYLGIDAQNWLRPSVAYPALGAMTAERVEQYGRFVANRTGVEDLDHFRQSIQRNQITGKQNFEDAITLRIGRRVYKRGPGRTSQEK